ncbi:helix-turn-helix domain-containing protein [Streptosporangium sandarakinum]|uniref:helix-turn-helix domain-containing protein n=1 Tax=Streptosporangium sandarakinum TaxID=1260955 RepID=UPI00378A6EEA
MCWLSSSTRSTDRDDNTSFRHGTRTHPNHVAALPSGGPVDPGLRVTLDFHPDRPVGEPVILDRLAKDGVQGLEQQPNGQWRQGAVEARLIATDRSVVGGGVRRGARPRCSSPDLPFATADLATLDAFRAAALGDLETADPSGALVETLAAWLAAQGFTEATARRLGVYRHTVTNRMDRIARLTNSRLSTPEGVLEYQLALRIRDLGRA